MDDEQYTKKRRMKLQLLSDLHLEVAHYKVKINKEADVLILAGDITDWNDRNKIKPILDQVTIPIIHVCGNHEYWNAPSLEEVNEYYRSLTQTYPHFHFLNDQTIEIGDVVFAGTTLWSNFNYANDPLECARKIVNFIGDFYKIKFNPASELTGLDIMNLNLKAREFLREIDSNGKRLVVVSHFGCHSNSIGEKYRHETHTNPYFVCDCSEFFDRVDLWVHGHVHNSFNYRVNKTQVMTNPRGYYSENKDFQGKMLLEV